MMLINLVFDQNALGAPQGFRDTVQSAANLICATFSDPITVNLSVGYGEITAGSTVSPLTNGAAEALATAGGVFSYSQVRGLLAAQVSADVLSGVQALPDAAAVQGQSTVAVWSAEEKALGLIPAGAAGLDGAAGFAADIPTDLLLGVAVHELTHAMGRVIAADSQADVLDLYRFAWPGAHLFGQSPAPSAYFSLDGGVTDLADYGQGSDPADFLSSTGRTPNDAFNEYYGAGTLQGFSRVDLLQMEALGFHLASSGAPDPVVHTAAPVYVAPAGVTTIYLTGANQTVTANNAGDVLFSNDTANGLVGGTGNDVFHLGRGGDWVTGGGGNDTFAFAGMPWAGGHIGDFGAGDVLDLSGLMSTTFDTGSDGFADGYLTITDDGQGDAQVWAQYANAGAYSGWWLVETLDGVAPSSLQHVGDAITVGASSSGGGGATPGPTDVTTTDANYTAAAGVRSITLTGSQQHVDASATNGVTISSNDTGNVLIGGSGGDVFHLGRGGDWAAGGAGADTFAYAATPWAGGGITDFNAAEGDRIDVSGLLHTAGYAGSDPFADGYLRFAADAAGNAQLWSDLHQPGNDSWWLVATLDGVSTSSLHYSGGLIT
jgi:Ca2+-binding RTX toxin-like protein